MSAGSLQAKYLTLNLQTTSTCNIKFKAFQFMLTTSHTGIGMFNPGELRNGWSIFKKAFTGR